MRLTLSFSHFQVSVDSYATLLREKRKSYAKLSLITENGFSEKIFYVLSSFRRLILTYEQQQTEVIN